MTIRALPANQSVNDSLHSHYRQQLSALMDDELEADQARFLLRRITHDEALAGCQERWQLIGDVLRGQVNVLAPVSFAAQVQHALDAQVAISPKTYSRWKPWGAGIALAASMAAVSVLLVTHSSFLAGPSSVETVLSAADVSSNAPQHARVLSPQPPVSVTPIDPFALAPEAVAKPWPRSNLPTPSGTFNARALSQNEPFYPFTPLEPSSDSPSSH